MVLEQAEIAWDGLEAPVDAFQRIFQRGAIEMSLDRLQMHWDAFQTAWHGFEAPWETF